MIDSIIINEYMFCMRAPLGRAYALSKVVVDHDVKTRTTRIVLDVEIPLQNADIANLLATPIRLGANSSFLEPRIVERWTECVVKQACDEDGSHPRTLVHLAGTIAERVVA